MSDAAERFAGDLRDAGVTPDDVAHIARLYEIALSRAHQSDWERLYRATFWVLERTRSREVPCSRTAAESLMRLLEDDLGTALFGASALMRLRVRRGDETTQYVAK